LTKWNDIVGEKNEAARDDLKHIEFDEKFVQMYGVALQDLVKEGNEAAKVVSKSIFERDDLYRDTMITLRAWAWNIHHNTWGEESFAGIIKARVVVMRIRGKER
jgi:hypothetical protein